MTTEEQPGKPRLVNNHITSLSQEHIKEPNDMYIKLNHKRKRSYTLYTHTLFNIDNIPSKLTPFANAWVAAA